MVQHTMVQHAMGSMQWYGVAQDSEISSIARGGNIEETQIMKVRMMNQYNQIIHFNS